MDGVHDMGGMHGFGKVPYEKNQPTFHHDWERRVWGGVKGRPTRIVQTSTMDAIASS